MVLVLEKLQLLDSKDQQQTLCLHVDCSLRESKHGPSRDTQSLRFAQAFVVKSHSTTCIDSDGVDKPLGRLRIPLCADDSGTFGSYSTIELLIRKRDLLSGEDEEFGRAYVNLESQHSTGARSAPIRVNIANRRGYGSRGWIDVTLQFDGSLSNQISYADEEVVVCTIFVGTICSHGSTNPLRLCARNKDKLSNSFSILQTPLLELGDQKADSSWWGGALELLVPWACSLELEVCDEANETIDTSIVSVKDLVSSNSYGAWTRIGEQTSAWLVTNVYSHMSNWYGPDGKTYDLLNINIDWTSKSSDHLEKYFVVAHMFPSTATRGRVKLRDVVRSLTHDKNIWNEDLHIPISEATAADASLCFAIYKETPLGTEFQGYTNESIRVILSHTRLGKKYVVASLQQCKLDVQLCLGARLTSMAQYNTPRLESNQEETKAAATPSTSSTHEKSSRIFRTDFLSDTEIARNTCETRPGSIYIVLQDEEILRDTDIPETQHMSTIELSSGSWKARNTHGKTTFYVPQQWSDRQRVIPTLNLKTVENGATIAVLDLAILCMYPHEAVQVRLKGSNDAKRNEIVIRASFGRPQRNWPNMVPAGKLHFTLKSLTLSSHNLQLDSLQLELHLRSEDQVEPAVFAGTSADFTGHTVWVCESSKDSPFLDLCLVETGSGQRIAEANIILPPKICIDGHIMHAEVPLRSISRLGTKLARAEVQIQYVAEPSLGLQSATDISTEKTPHVKLKIMALENLSLSPAFYRWSGRLALSIRLTHLTLGTSWRCPPVHHEDRFSPIWYFPVDLPCGNYQATLCNDDALPDNIYHEISMSLDRIDLQIDREFTVDLPQVGRVVFSTLQESLSTRHVEDIEDRNVSLNLAQGTAVLHPDNTTVSRKATHSWVTIQIDDLEGFINRGCEDFFFRLSGSTTPSIVTPRNELNNKLRLAVDLDLTSSLTLTFCRDDEHAVDNEIGTGEILLAQPGPFTLSLLHSVTSRPVGIEVSGTVRVLKQEAKPRRGSFHGTDDQERLVQDCLTASRLKHIFSKIDVDGSGAISRTEFLTSFKEDTALLDAIGLSSQDPERLFARLDQNGDGTLVWAEFVNFASIIASNRTNLADFTDELGDANLPPVNEKDEHLSSEQNTTPKRMTQKRAQKQLKDYDDKSSPLRRKQKKDSRRSRKFAQVKRENNLVSSRHTTAAISTRARSPTRKATPGKKAKKIKKRSVSSSARSMGDNIVDDSDQGDASLPQPDELGHDSMQGSNHHTTANNYGNSAPTGLALRVRELEHELEVQRQLHEQEKASLHADKDRVMLELDNLREETETLQESHERKKRELDLEKKRHKDVHQKMNDVLAELVSYRKIGEEGTEEDQWKLIRLRALTKEQDLRLERAHEKRAFEAQIAAKLQAWRRAALARRNYRAKLNERTQAAIELQAVARKKIAQKQFSHRRDTALRGCTVLQAIYRGRLARRGIAAENAAASKIQAYARGQRDRAVAKRLAHEQTCARRIQSQIRRRQSMREYKALLEERIRCVEAATVIQKRVRGLHARESYALRLDEHRQHSLENQSAARMQALARRSTAVKKFSNLKSQKTAISKAAMEIQHFARSRQTYKSTKLDVAMHQLLTHTASIKSGTIPEIPSDPVKYLRSFIAAQGLSNQTLSKARDRVAQSCFSTNDNSIQEQPTTTRPSVTTVHSKNSSTNSKPGSVGGTQEILLKQQSRSLNQVPHPSLKILQEYAPELVEAAMLKYSSSERE